MLFKVEWSSIACAALAMIACAEPESNAPFERAAEGGEAGARGNNAGAPNCASAGAVGVSREAPCGGLASGGALAGSGASSSGAGGSLAGSGVTGGGGAMRGARSESGGASGAATGAGGARSASTGIGGASSAGGGGGNATGGMLGRCDLLLLQAKAMLQGAQTCYTSSGEPFCTGYTTNECGCKVPVNNPSSIDTDNYLKALGAFRDECSATCAVPCVEPKSQTCQLIFGLVVGACVAM